MRTLGIYGLKPILSYSKLTLIPTTCLFSQYFNQSFLSQNLTTQRNVGGKGGDNVFLSLQLPPAHEYSRIYLQLCYPTVTR